MTNKQFRSLFYFLDKHFGSKAQLTMTVRHYTALGNPCLRVITHQNGQHKVIEFNTLTKKWSFV